MVYISVNYMYGYCVTSYWWRLLRLTLYQNVQGNTLQKFQCFVLGACAETRGRTANRGPTDCRRQRSMYETSHGAMNCKPLEKCWLQLCCMLLQLATKLQSKICNLVAFSNADHCELQLSCKLCVAISLQVATLNLQL